MNELRKQVDELMTTNLEQNAELVDKNKVNIEALRAVLVNALNNALCFKFKFPSTLPGR